MDCDPPLRSSSSPSHSCRNQPCEEADRLRRALWRALEAVRLLMRYCVGRLTSEQQAAIRQALDEGQEAIGGS